MSLELRGDPELPKRPIDSKRPRIRLESSLRKLILQLETMAQTVLVIEHAVEVRLAYEEQQMRHPHKG